MSATNFSDNLKRCRQRAKLTVQECASIAGVGIASWYKYESGDQWPTDPEKMDDIAGAVGVATVRLFHS